MELHPSGLRSDSSVLPPQVSQTLVSWGPASVAVVLGREAGPTHTGEPG